MMLHNIILHLTRIAMNNHCPRISVNLYFLEVLKSTNYPVSTCNMLFVGDTTTTTTTLKPTLASATAAASQLLNISSTSSPLQSSTHSGSHLASSSNQLPAATPPTGDNQTILKDVFSSPAQEYWEYVF